MHSINVIKRRRFRRKSRIQNFFLFLFPFYSILFLFSLLPELLQTLTGSPPLLQFSPSLSSSRLVQWCNISQTSQCETRAITLIEISPHAIAPNSVKIKLRIVRGAHNWWRKLWGRQECRKFDLVVSILLFEIEIVN